MSLRDDLRTILSDFAIQAWAAKGIIHPGPTADLILAAIEAERPAIEAAERERLAKAAEELDAFIEVFDEETTSVNEITVADWIRSQGETK